MSNKPSSAANDLQFRIARTDDLDAIIALLADDELGAQRETTSPEARPVYKAAFEAITNDANNELLVAQIANRVVGCLQLTMLPGLTYKGGTRAQIEGVRVSRDVRGQSIGKKLFAFTIERARAKGAFMVQLTTTATRDDATRFYEQLGFAATHSGLKLML